MTSPTGTLALNLEARVREGFTRASRTLHGVPLQYRNFAYDVRRGRVRPAGQLIEYLVACLDAGANIADALAPIDEMRDFLLSRAAKGRCALEVARKEALEEGEANEATIAILAGKLTDSEKRAAIQELRDHRAKLDLLIHVLEAT